MANERSGEQRQGSDRQGEGERTQRPGDQPEHGGNREPQRGGERGASEEQERAE